MMTFIKKSNVECYTVSNNGEFARIFIEPVDAPVNHGGDLVIASSYGCWDYFWTNTGSTPIKEFLCLIRKESLAEKLLCTDAHETNWPGTNKKVVAYIRENITVARKALLESLLRELERSGEPSEDLIFDFGWCDVEINEIIEANKVDKLNSNFEYFWDELWVPFIEELKKEIADGA